MLFIVLRFYNLSITPKVKAPKPIIEKPTVEKTISVSNVLKKENVIDDKISAEINAAISMALHLYYAEVHDEESNKITIKTVERRYSPWSSKIYGLNNLIR